MQDQKYTQSMREGFGKALLELGAKNSDIVALTADVAESTKVDLFAQKFPERFFDVGVAEQNLVGIATGMALEGKIPFAAGYASFLTGRAYDQIRILVAYNNANVKLIATHGGIATGPDGATHQMLEDIAMIRALPNITLIAPADAKQAYSATIAAAKHKGPIYLRLSRMDTPKVPQDENYKIGKAEILTEGNDILIISCGIMVYRALIAAAKLRREGIYASVINCHTIKPLDTTTILSVVKNARGVVVAEDAQIIGGLGSAISELISSNRPKPVRIVGIRDKFGESGNPEDLITKYHIDVPDIIEESLKAFRRLC